MNVVAPGVSIRLLNNGRSIDEKRRLVFDARRARFSLPRQIPGRPNRRLSLLSVANKQICLSLGIQRHFRLGEDRAVAQEETTAARCGLSSAREGRTKGIYDVHLSSLYLLSFLFPLSHSLSFSFAFVGQSRRYFPVLYRPLFSSVHALSLHSSLSPLSCDSPFYSSSFCLNLVACRTS